MKSLAVLALGALSAATFAATMDIHVDATITVASAVITNTFGFAVFPGESQKHKVAHANADAISDSTPSAVPFGGKHSLYTTGYALPDATDFSFAHGDAQSSQKINLANLLPSNTITINLGYTYTWSIDLATGDGETALGSVDVSFAGMNLVSKIFQIGANDSVNQSGGDSGTIPVTLPANSVTSKFFLAQLTGDVTSPPQAVPEPSSLLAVGAGAFAFLRRRRRTAL